MSQRAYYYRQLKKHHNTIQLNSQIRVSRTALSIVPLDKGQPIKLKLNLRDFKERFQLSQAIEKEKTPLVAAPLSDTPTSTGHRIDITHSIDVLPIKATQKNTMQHGFVPIPRHLFDDPIFDGLSIKHKYIVIRLYELAAYQPYDILINGHLVTLQPGQLAHSYRFIADKCNPKGRPGPKDKVTVADIQRTINFLGSFSKLIRQLIHGTQVITILDLVRHDNNKKTTDTASDTSLIQERYKEKNREQNKERKAGRPPASIKTANATQATTDSSNGASSKRDGQQRDVPPSSLPQNLPPELLQFDPRDAEQAWAASLGKANRVGWALASLRAGWRRREAVDEAANEVEAKRVEAIDGRVVACSKHVEVVRGPVCEVIEYKDVAFGVKFAAAVGRLGLLGGGGGAVRGIVCGE